MPEHSWAVAQPQGPGNGRVLTGKATAAALCPEAQGLFFFQSKKKRLVLSTSVCLIHRTETKAGEVQSSSVYSIRLISGLNKPSKSKSLLKTSKHTS